MLRRRVYTNHMITLVTVHDLFFHPPLPQFMHCEAFPTMKMAARATAARARDSIPEQPSRTQPAGGSQLWMMLQICWFNFDESMLLSIFNVAYLFPTTCPNHVPWHDIINANILLWFLEWGHTAMDNRIHVGVLGCLVIVLDKSYNPVPLAWYDRTISRNKRFIFMCSSFKYSGLIIGLCLANEIRRYFLTTPLAGWVQTQNKSWILNYIIFVQVCFVISRLRYLSVTWIFKPALEVRHWQVTIPM